MIYPINLRSRIFYIPLVLGSLVASFYLIGIIFSFLGNFSNIFAILLIAWVIAIILRPLVSYAKSKKVSPVIAIVLSFLLLIAIVVIIGYFVLPSLYGELNLLARKISSASFDQTVNVILSNLHVGNLNISDTIVSHVNQFISYLLTNGVGLVSNILGIILDLVLSFFFAFFFLYQGAEWKKKIIARIPENYRNDFIVITESIADGIHGFIKGQTIIALISAIAAMIIMKILGLNLIVVAGIYVFLAMYFPVIGPPVAVIFPLLIALTSSFTVFVILLVSLLVVFQIVTNIIQPKVFSKSLGLHPVLVVLSFLVGAQLFGIGGALLALPVASIIQSLFIHYSN